MLEKASAAITPIVAGFYPDPTICRVGEDYYLAHSSFEYFPGAPIFHSTDLVTWRQIGNILDRRSQFVRGDPRPSTGIYGSTLRHHDGMFWFITTNVSDHESGQLIVHTEDPSGDWSDPVRVPKAVGIDPDLCWDSDGQCLLTWRALDFTNGEDCVRQAPLDLATGELTAPAYDVWQGSGLPGAEAPHLYHIDGSWYLMLAEGGTERGHCVTMARAPRPQGPFVACPDNPILTRRSTSEPVQNVGHADLVQAPDGTWAAVYLGVRPRGSTPGFHVLGRETFIAGLDWVDDWPVLDVHRFEVPQSQHAWFDDFSAAALDLRWVVPGGEPDTIATRSDQGLEIREAVDVPGGLLCARVRDLTWVAEATVRGHGRFVVRIDDRHWYGLVLGDGLVRAQAQLGDVSQCLGEFEAGHKPCVLRIECVPASSLPVPRGHAGPDEIRLVLVDGSEHHEMARLDGRYLSTEVASGFTGRMLGLGPGHVVSTSYAPTTY